KDQVVGVLTYDLFMKRKRLAMGTRIGHIMSPAPQITETEAVVDVSEKLLYTDARTLPVTKRGKITGVVSRRDVAKSLLVSREVMDLGIGAIMTPDPKTVSETDKITKAMALMKEMDERFVPVLDRQDRIAGVLGRRELVNLHTKRHKETRGDKVGKSETLDVVVSSLMRAPVVVTEDMPVSRAVQLMYDKNIPSVLIGEDGKLKGVVTEEDLLELVVSLKDREGVFVQLSGLEHVDPDVYDAVYEMVEKSMRKIAKLWSPQTLLLHFTEHNAEGGEHKYSVHMRLNTKKTVFYAHSSEWNFFGVVSDALDELEKVARRERERTKKKGRKRDNGQE
ncbi:MAG: CBS domain-containing protein, partial [Thermoplasmata archaeon]|nr:CBS domain-containing protein [Thermoplasmata archaeon]